MKQLSKDERHLIHEVNSYVRRHGRVKSAVPKVTALFLEVSAQAKKERQASVISAVPLLPDERKKIDTAIERLLHHSVTCHYTVHPSVIAGIKIQVADWIFDSTFESQIGSMSRSLITI